jgi:hypothetical protein
MQSGVTEREDGLGKDDLARASAKQLCRVYEGYRILGEGYEEERKLLADAILHKLPTQEALENIALRITEWEDGLEEDDLARASFKKLCWLYEGFSLLGALGEGYEEERKLLADAILRKSAAYAP